MRNVLLITSDQERWSSWDSLPLPGHQRLRAAGTEFDRFYAASVACSAARSTIYTGHHVATTCVIDNVGLPGQPSMTTALPTIGTRLRSLGFVTAYKGKWHLSTEALSPDLPAPLVGPRSKGRLRDALEPYGFSDYNELGDDLGGPYEGFRSDERIADDAVAWMSNEGRRCNLAGTPWLLAVNLVNPHDIMWGTLDEELLRRNAAQPAGLGFVGPPDTEVYRPFWDIPDDPSWTDSVHDDGRPAAHAEFAIANRAFTGRAASNMTELRHFRNYYVNCLRDVDRALSRVLDGLAASRQAMETVVVYTSDHGELAGSHGLFGKGPCSYDENLRLPLIIAVPGLEGGRKSKSIASQVDLVPTLVSLATEGTGQVERVLPGRDLGPSLSAATSVRDAALFAYDGLTYVDGEWALRTRAGMNADDQVTGRDLHGRGLMRTLITEQFKFSRYFAPGDHHVPSSVEELLERNSLELFDLENDPGERRNLAFGPDRDAALLEALCGQLNDLIADEIGEDDGSWLPALVGAPWHATEPTRPDHVLEQKIESETRRRGVRHDG